MLKKYYGIQPHKMKILEPVRKVINHLYEQDLMLFLKTARPYSRKHSCKIKKITHKYEKKEDCEIRKNQQYMKKKWRFRVYGGKVGIPTFLMYS